MTKFLEATYTDGNLILSEKLSSELEGKTLKILILETSKTETTDEAKSRRVKVQQFLEHAKKYSFKLPEDYKFNRDEIYER